MPNGYDKNWIRLCAAIDGFRSRYGRWPTRVRALPASLHDFHLLFTTEDLAKIASKVALVTDAASMVAEDDSGAQYDYGQEGFPDRLPHVRAADWLGVSPHHAPSLTAEDERETSEMMEGVFKGWTEGPFGFITPDDGSSDIRVFEGELSDSTEFETGRRVAFEIEFNPKTHERMAVRVNKAPSSRSGRSR